MNTAKVEKNPDYPWTIKKVEQFINSYNGELTARAIVDYFIMEQILPSKFQIGDKVSVRLKPMFVVDTAEVIEVHFSEGKVMYDLDVEFNYPALSENEPKGLTRILKVDAALLSEH